MLRRMVAAVAGAVVLTLASGGTAAFADVGNASSTPASCMGIEAAALSPPGSNPEALGGVPDIKAFLAQVAPGLPPGQVFFRVAATLHERSHEACDEALGG